MQPGLCLDEPILMEGWLPALAAELAGLCASTRRNPTQPKYTQTQNQIEKQAHHQAGVEFVEALHGPVAEAVAEVFLHKVGVVQDVICYQGLLRGKGRI